MKLSLVNKKLLVIVPVPLLDRYDTLAISRVGNRV